MKKKQKKSGNIDFSQIISLLTAIIELITAAVLLIEQFQK